ncbi:MAG: ribonuclease H-like domain-containing protein [Patescibacteria group bacterium]
MRKLYLDIETLPAPDNKHEVLRFLHEKAIEKNKKTGQDFEQYLLRTSFDGAFGRIFCIGYAMDDNPTEVLYAKDNEKEMLEKFWEIADQSDLFIGHNVMDFDLKFIYQRSIINSVKPSKDLSFARYRNFPIYDTMKEWSKWSYDVSIGLEALALALGIPTPKDGIDGSQVYNFYKEGKIEEILEYCKRDVDTTRAVYKRMCL